MGLISFYTKEILFTKHFSVLLLTLSQFCIRSQACQPHLALTTELLWSLFVDYQFLIRILCRHACGRLLSLRHYLGLNIILLTMYILRRCLRPYLAMSCYEMDMSVAILMPDNNSLKATNKQYVRRDVLRVTSTLKIIIK